MKDLLLYIITALLLFSRLWVSRYALPLVVYYVLNLHLHMVSCSTIVFE